jgi:diadenosine tetraphosphate (Ap4A) HIT family hydrolase
MTRFIIRCAVAALTLFINAYLFVDGHWGWGITFLFLTALVIISFFRNENCEIYEYQHYNQINKTEKIDCPFCNPDVERELIVESATAYAIYDKFPVNDGHALIIPKKHCSDYFALSFKEQAACIFMLNRVKEIVSEKFNPDGFNIGINIGEKAGQTVGHVHIHLIPRYNGDVEDPRGGVRGVIPNKQKY